MSQVLNKIITLCEKHYFLQASLLNSGESSIQKYNYGPPGELLKKNIFEEWFLSNVIKTEENVFQYSELGDIATSVEAVADAYKCAKLLNCHKLPFGLISSQDECINGKQDTLFSIEKIPQQSNYFWPKKFTALRAYLFLHPESSSQHFNWWQQKRKHWWRKFSANPGRYNLTDVKILPQGETVMVQAEFPWASEIVETICLRGTRVFECLDKESQADFEVKSGRKVVLPHVLESAIMLDRAVVAFLCDAFNQPLNTTKRKHPTLSLHRRLAPYKVTFSASFSNTYVAEELSDLALLLTRQLRRSSISTLLVPNFKEISLEIQHNRNDEMGIPYTVEMSEKTLKNGIIGLRSRDTSLKEMLHITDLSSHLRRLLKNY